MEDNGFFRYDKRLGIDLPNLTKNWEDYTCAEREQMVSDWEQIRGRIPDRIKAFEAGEAPANRACAG